MANGAGKGGGIKSEVVDPIPGEPEHVAAFPGPVAGIFLGYGVALIAFDGVRFHGFKVSGVHGVRV